MLFYTPKFLLLLTESVREAIKLSGRQAVQSFWRRARVSESSCLQVKKRERETSQLLRSMIMERKSTTYCRNNASVLLYFFLPVQLHNTDVRLFLHKYQMIAKMNIGKPIQISLQKNESSLFDISIYYSFTKKQEV